MAKKTFQQINFVTGVVDGTLAYDFDAPGYFNQEEEVERVRVPKRRRHPLSREQEWVREEPKGAHAAESEAARQLSYAVNGAAVLGSVIAVALLLLVLMAKIQLIGISSTALNYEAQIAELENQHSRLTVQYEEIFNLKDVEETAINALGMQEARDDQIYYLNGVTSSDRAVVITRQDADMFSLGLGDVLASARDYLDTLTN